MAEGFLARLGALLSAPRRLARRDLDAQDGKAGDDLLVVAGVALALHGAEPLFRMGRALAVGRVNTALHRLSEVLRHALPLLGLWVVVTVVFALFTFRSGRRAVGELGARVTEGFVVVRVLLSPLVDRLPEGPLAYAVRALPWAAGAVLFGLVLREAIEPAGEPRPAPAARRLGAGVLALFALIGVVRAHQAWRRTAAEPPVLAARGGPAPAIDLPLLGGGALHSRDLGRPALVTFWATWCGPCLAELPALEKAYRGRGPQAPLVYAVNVDEPGPDREAHVRATVQRLGLTVPVALDDGRAAQAYSVATIPTSVRLGAQHTLVEVIDRPLDEAELTELLR